MSGCYGPGVSAQRWPHQVGGVDALQGPVPGVDDAERFHEAWEARTFALGQTVRGLYTTDEFRHAIERLDAAGYVQITYFEKWLAAIERLAVEKGHVTPSELEAAREQRLQDLHEHTHALPAIRTHEDEHLQAPEAVERFTPGDTVILSGGLGAHHRLPDWARGRRGAVRSVRGRFALPDLVVAGTPTDLRYALYEVEVVATDAFWEADPRDRLLLDVYDPYLEPAP